MTVNELKEKLADLPPEMEVWYCDDFARPVMKASPSDIIAMDGKLLIYTF